MTTNSIEPFLRRDHIRCYGKDTLADEWNQVQKRSFFDWIEKRAVLILALLLTFCIFASVAYFFVPVAKAETINTPVENQSDRVQERTYCAQVLVGGREVQGAPSMQAIKDHCKSFGV